MLYGWLAASLGLAPVAFLALLAVAGHRVAGAWWIVAAAFGVSVVADLGSLVVGHPLVSQVYPLLQAALVLVVLLPRRAVELLVFALVLCASGSIVARGAQGLDVLLHVVAWGAVGAVAGVLLPAGRVRTALFIYFGLGTLAWLAFAWEASWATWGAYQGTRVVGIGWWMVAAHRDIVRAR